MKKNIFALSLFALLTASLHGMEQIWHSGFGEKADLDRIAGPVRQTEKQKQEEKRLQDLCLGMDPKRFGPLSLSEPNQLDAAVLMLEAKDDNFSYYKKYTPIRNRIANALVCGKYHDEFAKIATNYRDYYLWEHLINNHAQIKEKHKIDVLRARDSGGPLILRLGSPEIIDLFIAKDKESIKQTNYGNTIVHEASFNRSLAFLEYCIEKYPAGVHCINDSGENPLHLLIQHIRFQPRNFVQPKFAALQKAGINLWRKNNHGKTALDQLKARIENGDEEFIESRPLSSCANDLEKAMNEQCHSKITQATGKDCSICLMPMDMNMHMLHCLHVFHEPCITQSMQAEYKNCPVCNATIAPKKESHAYYDSDDDDFHDESSTNNPPPLSPFGSLNLAAVIAASNSQGNSNDNP